jgi:hypothetical protein
VTRRFLLSAFVLGLVLGACSTSEPAPEPTAEPAGPEQIVACVGIEPAPCNALVVQAAAALPAGRGLPVSFQLVLAECDGPPCGPGMISGQVTAEWLDGGEPVMFSFVGPVAAPEFDVVDAAWSGVVQPRSERVAPAVPVPFTLGHCGLLHVVDFDGSFWVPVGRVSLDDPEMINAAAGQMQLVAPNRAQFSKGGKLIATLARFPGPKHFFLCD